MKMRTTGIILALALAGCQPSNEPSTTATPPATSRTPAITATPRATPAEDTAQVDTSALLAQLDGDKFPYEEAKKKENGPVFLAIAETSENSDAVVAALRGLINTYSSRQESEKRNSAGEDYKAVIAKHLASEDPKVKHWAIRASAHALGENPAPEVVDQLVVFITEGPVVGQRHDAVDVMNSLKDYAKDPKVAEALYVALDDEHPAVRSEALFRLRGKTYGLEEKEKFLNKGLELTGHEDPGVRGRALSFVGKLGRDHEDKVKPVLLEGLKDPHPYPRSEALSALAYMKATDALPEIMPLLDDSEKNTYQITFENLLGQKDRVHHDGSPWSRVDDAALRSIKSMTFMMKEQKFELGDIKGKTKEEDIAREVGRAKEWYANNKDSLN